MELKDNLLTIKRKQAFEECFDGSYFKITPLDPFILGKLGDNDVKILEVTHCVYFKDMSKENICELKNLVRKVLEMSEPTNLPKGENLPKEKPWWKFW